MGVSGKEPKNFKRTTRPELLSYILHSEVSQYFGAF